MILVTGAAGQIGRLLRAGLPQHGWALRCHDIADLGAAGPGEELVQADVTDLAAFVAAAEGTTAIVHLGGNPKESPWEAINRVNIEGTYNAFEAARLAGVPRVVFASSNHAVGFTPRARLASVDVRARPDGYYGVSKAAGEALGSLYADRYGLDVVCLRIGSQLPRPLRPRHLSTWLSDGDTVRLVHAALSAPSPGFAVVYGISANSRGWWDLAPGRTLGYHPADDAEDFAAEVIAEHGEPDLAEVTEAFIGGEFCGPEYDADRL